MRQSIDDACAELPERRNRRRLGFWPCRHYLNWLCLPTDFNYTTEQLGDLTKDGIADELYKRGMDILTAKEKRYGAKTMRELSVSACCAMLTPSGWSTLTTWTS